MDGLTIGSTVHYVLPSGPHEGEHRPAIVVRVWSMAEVPEGTVNLQVLNDGAGDGPQLNAYGLTWICAVRYSAVCRQGTWHWPERA